MDRSPTPPDELLDALPMPYLAVQPITDHGSGTDLCVTWANASALRRFGDDVVGRWVQRDQPFGCLDVQAGVLAASTRERTFERVVLRDGLRENHRIHIVPLSTGGASMLVENIDAEVHTRDALSASSDALARVQHWGHIGVWDLDVGTGEVYWSTQVHDLLGRDQPGLDEFRSAVHPEDVPLIDHLKTRVLAQPGPYRATHRIIRDGEVRTLDQHVQSVADDHGRPVRLIGTMVDVTEMHALRDQVARAERAHTIGVVAAGIAHDFNNLLTVVEGHAGLLLTQTEDEDMRSGLEAIKRAAAQASTTTRKLMGLGRVEPVNCVPVEVGDLLADVTAWTRPAAPQVKLVEEVREADLVAIADETVLRQVLLDLVLNACDARATSVRLVADEVVLDRTAGAVASGDLRSGDYVRIDVTDDGTGMDDATRERALEPFFSTKPQEGGSGLGLASASTNVTRMHGHLTIDTEPGRGTTVSILLPRLVETPDEHRPPSRPHATRIVVACADREQAERARRLVTDEGHQVVVASDLQALEFCLASEPIDAAVVQVGFADEDAWPDELHRRPTVWMDELHTADSLRRTRARIEDFFPET